MSRWQLGNPSLIIDLPADPSGGGVPWHDSTIAILPTSWSAESADLRVEVAERYTFDRPEVLAEAISSKMGSKIKRGVGRDVSGVPGYAFTTSNGVGLALSGEGRAWIIFLKPKSSAGNALVARVLDSIVLERWGDYRWVRRNLGDTRMNAELPFELAPTPSDDANRKQYELHFSDFGINASVATADEGKDIDLEGTIKGLVESEKSKSDPKEFSVKREKVKSDQIQGDLVTMTIKQGSKKGVRSVFFCLDKGSLLRMETDAQFGNAQHEAWTKQVLDSLRVSNVTFGGFVPRQVGSEGVWFDVSKDFAATTAESNLKRFNVFVGAFEMNVRVQTLPAGVQQNVDQFMMIEEAGFKPRDEVRDYKAETSRRFVDGIESRVLRLQFKRPGRADHELRTAIVLFLPDRTVVGEIVANEEQGAYIDRIVNTAHVVLPTPAGWTRKNLGESGISVVVGKTDPTEKGNPGSGASQILDTIFQDDDIFAGIREYKYSGDAPIPGILVNQLFQELKGQFKTDGRILEQRPYSVGDRSGVYCVYEYDHPTVGKLPLDVVILRKGSYITALIVMPTPGKADALLKKAVLINSFK